MIRRLLRPHVILLLFVLFVASIPLQLQATSRPEFCVSCHEMRPMAATFKKSTHAAVGCMGCHTDPGYLNYVRDKIHAAVNDVYHHFAGYEEPIRGHVPNYRCLSCHPTITTRNTFQQLAVAHNKHVGMGVRCITCHLKVGHQSFTIASAGGIRDIVTRFEQTHRQTTLNTCFASGCHDNKAAPTACATCHVDQQRVKPKSHRPGFLALHGRLARKDARDCLTCHETLAATTVARPAPAGDTASEDQPVAESPASAPTIIPASLGSPASTTDRAREYEWLASLPRSGTGQSSQPAARDMGLTAGRTTSSDAPAKQAAFQRLIGTQFCQNCHRKENPHPKGFERTHGEVAQRAAANCATCHAKTQCDTCHKTPMPHPEGFVHQHGTPAAASEANCQYCHQKRECESCHATLKPTSHTPTFVQQHGKVATSAGADCQFCHQKRDCDGCHHATRPTWHTADFRQKHGAIAKKSTQECLMCHRQNTCNSCHQLPMPHPPKYQANHTVDASHHESACANCHRKSYCTKCHESDEIHIPNVRLPDDGGDPLKRLARWQADQEAGRCPVMSKAP